MERREPPETEEGWYALHDFRRVDWSAWRSAPERERDRALREGIDFLRTVTDPAAGESAVFSITGHKADLLVIHFRPDMADLNALERSFERTDLAAFTERATSYVSVTEASGYNVDLDAVLEGEADTGLQRYIQSRLEPSVPDADHVCFYPMDKRRDPEQNWYDLPFEERAEHMEAHGDIGRDYAGEVSQVVTSSVGFDDWEWGVTLFAQDAAQIKRLLYEMRFDRSTSQFAEFGPFYIGQQIDPDDLRPLFAGERVPADENDKVGVVGRARGESERAGGGPPPGVGRDGESSGPPDWVDTGDAGDGPETSGSDGRGHGGESESESSVHRTGDDGDDDSDDGIRGELADIGVYAGQPNGEDVHAVVVYSEADTEELFEEVRGLRANFDHYGTHRKTAVYEGREDADGDTLSAVASVWETESAADTAGGFLSDLPGIVGRAGDDATENGWGTMGMFYTVDPDYREQFHERFEEVHDLLSELDGHLETDLLVNRETPEDMFIASRWESREDATEFFRSEEFAETVDWGRDVLTDRPRHVFLA